MKVALFKNVKHGFEMVADESYEVLENHIRLSEYYNVNFIMISDEEVTIKMINSLKQTKKKIQAEAQLELTQVDKRIGDLLALTQD